VACPQCAKMLDDAVKLEEVEDKIEVLDVAEIVTRALV
jgi:Fe-S oxidoreductase